jgi:uncharacterized membrane protein
LSEESTLINAFCLAWFLTCWIGYASFAGYRATKHSCIASELHSYRELWMRRVMLRDIRVGDASLIANLERNVSFLASTTIFIVAGLITVLAVADQVIDLVSTIPFSSPGSVLSVQLKLTLLVAMFVYAFFTFTWSMRQYGFASILLGGAPMVDEKNVNDGDRQRYAKYSARIIDLAGHSYNQGLRAYYFALSVLTWFVSPYLFIVASFFVVAVLYRREFQSRSLSALRQLSQ